MLGKPSGRLKKHLEKNGKRANATILEIADKGMTVTSGNEHVVGNTEFVLKTRLKVQPEDEPEFEVEQKFRFMQLAVPSAGSVLAVIYDPADHDKIMLDDSPEAQQQATLSSAGLDPNAIAQMMNQAQQWQAQAGQMPAGQMPGTAPPASAQQAPDPVEQLEKLAALKEKGALTDAEFEAEKARILGK
jgi:hypothetical protein